MTTSTELLQGATAIIEAWLTRVDAARSLQELRTAIDLGGRALLNPESADEDAANRYRQTLLKLKDELPRIEERLNWQRRKLQQERESLERAVQWANESRQVV